MRQRIEAGGERLWRLEDSRDLLFTAVAQALSRLTREGLLERLSKGIYYHGRQTAFGKNLPNPAAMQKLAAGRKTVFPSGIAAANLLGFTTRTARRSEVSTSALSLPRKLVGSDTLIHTRRPEAWASLPEADAALLDFLRRSGRTSELSPDETVRKTVALFREPGRFERPAKVAASEPPRARSSAPSASSSIRAPSAHRSARTPSTANRRGCATSWAPIRPRPSFPRKAGPSAASAATAGSPARSASAAQARSQTACCSKPARPRYGAILESRASVSIRWQCVPHPRSDSGRPSPGSTAVDPWIARWSRGRQFPAPEQPESFVLRTDERIRRHILRNITRTRSRRGRRFCGGQPHARSSQPTAASAAQLPRKLRRSARTFAGMCAHACGSKFRCGPGTASPLWRRLCFQVFSAGSRSALRLPKEPVAGPETLTEHRYSSLQAALCRYLIAHPQAKDTIEGIWQFWLGSRQDFCGDLENVIADLVQRGWLRRWSLGGTEIYGFDRTALPHLRTWLREHSREAD